jgi:hypothetical protein
MAAAIAGKAGYILAWRAVIEEHSDLCVFLQG